MSPDELLSWDGRKTADFTKTSNDGLWIWDGFRWLPRRKGEKKISHNDSSKESIQEIIQSESVHLAKSPSRSEEMVNHDFSMDVGTISPEGHHQWDGSKWIPVELTKLSDDGIWMWNGRDWIPNPNRAIYNKEPAQSQFEQMQSAQVAQYSGFTQSTQMLLIRPTKESKSGLLISLSIILPVLFVGFIIIIAAVLYVSESDIAEEEGQNDLAGTWYNTGDTLTLYSDGSVDESTGNVVAWSSQGENLTITFLIDEEEIILIWKYKIMIDSDEDRVLFMAYYDSGDGIQTNEVAENSCVVYVDSVKGTEDDYMEKKRAIIPDWCDFVEQ
jgi:hypothetical protein